MNKSKLLLDEEPLLIMPQLATKIGLNESIILQQIHYWTEINRKADKNFKNNFYWAYNTYEEWQKQFPFWSLSTIKRIINNLKKQDLIICGNYNKMKIDRTIWYRINYKKLQNVENSDSFPLGQIDTMDEVKMTRPIPETKQRIGKLKYNRKHKDGKLTDYQAKTVADMANIENIKKRKEV